MCLGFDWRKRGDSLRNIIPLRLLSLYSSYTSLIFIVSLSLSLAKKHIYMMKGKTGIQPFPAGGSPTAGFSLPLKCERRQRVAAYSSSELPPIKKDTQGVFFYWRKRGDSNPWAREDYTISNRARYDHFDTLPYYVFILKLCRDFYRQLFYFICFLFKCQLFFKCFIKLFKVFWFFAPLRQLLRFPCSAYYDINHLQNKLRYDIIRYGEIYGSHRI